MKNASITIKYGERATELVNNYLSEPFTVYTAFANAPGRSKLPRVYGFIKTSKAEDLATILVKKGLCRPFGLGRETVDSIRRDEMFAMLSDYQYEAMLRRSGIWKESNPDYLAELRKAQRADEMELKQLGIELKQKSLPKEKIDINQASKEQIEAIKGIGSALAQKVIDGRPYTSANQLLAIKGIGKSTKNNIMKYFLISY